MSKAKLYKLSINSEQDNDDSFLDEKSRKIDSLRQEDIDKLTHMRQNRERSMSKPKSSLK